MRSHEEGKREQVGKTWVKAGRFGTWEEFCVIAVSRKEILAASDGECPVIPATKDTETGEWQG